MIAPSGPRSKSTNHYVCGQHENLSVASLWGIPNHFIVQKFIEPDVVTMTAYASAAMTIGKLYKSSTLAIFLLGLLAEGMSIFSCNVFDKTCTINRRFRYTIL